MRMKKMLAMLMVIAMSATTMSGCVGHRDKGGITTVSWYLAGVKRDASYDAVFDKVNEIMGERYGINLKIVLVDESNFSQKIQTMNATRDEYDLVFTSNWRNSFYTNVANNSLYDLTELLPEYAPTLYESLSQAELDAVTMDKKIYAVPNWQSRSRITGVYIPREQLEKTSYTMDMINSIEDLEGFYEEFYKIEPESNRATGTWQTYMTTKGIINVVQEGLPGAIFYNKTGKPQIINQYETEEFEDFAKLVRSWVEKGYYPEVRATQENEKASKLDSPGGWENWNPGSGKQVSLRTGHEYLDKPITQGIISNDTLLSTLTGVSANSKHPVEAVKVLEIMHTDKEIYNMLSFGLEGVNYDKVGENIIRVREDNTYSIHNWAIGSVANSFILEGNDENLWEITKERDKNALVSPLIGFNPDTSKINEELGNCQTVVNEYISTIQYGYEDPMVTVPKFREELKAAGADVIIEEIQKQIDEWWEKN